MIKEGHNISGMLKINRININLMILLFDDKIKMARKLEKIKKENSVKLTWESKR